MSAFDEQFADRTREVFDAYAEPVDEPTWDRVQAALAADRAAARDRPPVAGAWARRTRALVALATLVLVAGLGTWALWPNTPLPPETGPIAVHTDAAPTAPIRPAPVPTAPATPSPIGDATPRAPASPPPPLLAQVVRPTPSAVPERRSAFRSEAVGSSRGRLSDVPPSETAPAAILEAPTTAEREEDRAPVPVDEMAQADRPLNGALRSRQPAVVREPDAVTDRTDDTVRGSGAMESESTVASSPAPPRMGTDVVLTTHAAFSGRQLAEGAGVTAGITREWRVRSGVSVSTGALAAYTRLATNPEASLGDALFDLEADPSRSAEVPNQTTLSTLALEVPLDVVVDVLATDRGRLRVGAGLTTSLYLAETFEDQGTRYALDPQLTSEGAAQFTTSAYRTTESTGPLSRLDLGRQANLSVGYSLSRTPLSVDAYTRLPLGGLTSRDLELTVVGLRLRLGL